MYNYIVSIFGHLFSSIYLLVKKTIEKKRGEVGTIRNRKSCL